jgi:uncharacterized protein (DUF1810 family)
MPEMEKISDSEDDLKRFLDAQEKSYSLALSEIRQGRKKTHWMWFIFPQIKGLGNSETSKFFAIKNTAEAASFLKHPVLGKRLIQICKELYNLEETSANKIFGSPDDLKLKSSMTLFSSLPDANPVFGLILDKYYNGLKDEKTMRIISG